MQFNMKKTSVIALLIVASLLVVLPLQMVKAQTTTVAVSPQTSTPVVGQTLTINIQLNNVQNLYGVDVTLNWNPAYLSLKTNQSFVDVKTYPNGILNDPVSVVEDTATQTTGEYHLVATSYSPATGFSGSGTIATLTFTVTSAGQSSLTLSSTLANYAPGGTSEPITHTDISGTVDATQTSSSPSTSPTPSSLSTASPSSSPSTSPTPSSSATSSPSTSSSPKPFLQSATFVELLAVIVVVVVILVSAAVVLSRKIMKKTASST